jgi:hypothetical protein
VNTWQQYRNCPFNYPELTDCFFGITSGGKTGGYFQYGNVLVKLQKSILIQGGFKNAGANIEVAAPEDGAKLLESPEEPITGGLKVITPKIQQQAEWPEELKASFAAAVKGGGAKATATIEMAGNECTTVPGCLNTESLIFEEPSPPAFRLPLKVTVKNAWLESLGGGPCQIGSDENPIKQNLVTSGAGRAGEIRFEEPNFEQDEVNNSQLVDLGWHIPLAAGANGCGGAYEEYVDRALNIALEVISPFGFGEIKQRTGVTVLTGNLHDSAAHRAQQEVEAGHK